MHLQRVVPIACQDHVMGCISSSSSGRLAREADDAPKHADVQRKMHLPEAEVLSIILCLKGQSQFQLALSIWHGRKCF